MGRTAYDPTWEVEDETGRLGDGGRGLAPHPGRGDGAGPDTINGTSSADEIRGFAGSDRLNGRGGNDGLHGGTGADAISGGAGSDTINGGRGNDNIDSRDDASQDYVYCGPGYDVYNAEPQPGAPQDFVADDCEVGAL